MRQKRRRIRFRWGPILWVLLVANIVAGLCFSPLTAIRRVRVDGAPDWDAPRLIAIMNGLEGVPCAQVQRSKVESEVLSLPEVRSAHLSRNLFGSAVLQLGYRQAVARLRDHPNVGVSLEGVLYRSEHLAPDLPSIKLDAARDRGTVGIAESWPVVAVARLAVESRELANGQPTWIELGKGSVLCLNMGTGQVNFGSCDDMDAKLAALKRLLSKDPTYLSKVQALNLAVASAPSAIPKGIGVQN